MMVETLVFDKAQITCKWNYSVPKWGGACHPLTSMCGEAIVIIKSDMQNTTGTLSPGAHAGSYNGQDAYNDMLITDGSKSNRKRTALPNDDGNNIERSGLYARSAGNSNRGGHEEDMKTVVRRLTPIECTRLQGFPDSWCEIGDWVDSKGKLHKDADSPKYKALGNSICLPYWEWLARRIAAQYERPMTMGSLFDGISGFPLAFARVGAIPVWSSEIEEFPIAVAKKHFGDEENGTCGDYQIR